jgi:hypothetical protein
MCTTCNLNFVFCCLFMFNSAFANFTDKNNSAVSVYYTLGVFESESVKYIERLSDDTNNLVVLMGIEYFKLKNYGLEINEKGFCTKCLDVISKIVNNQRIIGFLPYSSEYFPKTYFQNKDSLLYKAMINKINVWNKDTLKKQEISASWQNVLLKDTVFAHKLFRETCFNYKLNYIDSLFLYYNIFNKNNNSFNLQHVLELLPKNKHIHLFYDETEVSNQLDFFDYFSSVDNIEKYIFVTNKFKSIDCYDGTRTYRYRNLFFKKHKSLDKIYISDLPKRVRISKFTQVSRANLSGFNIIFLNNATHCN